MLQAHYAPHLSPDCLALFALPIAAAKGAGLFTPGIFFLRCPKTCETDCAAGDAGIVGADVGSSVGGSFIDDDSPGRLTGE